MKKKIGDFRIGKTIGTGTFGNVREATHLPTGQKVAIKVLEKRKILEYNDLTRIQREITLLKKLNHNNILHLLELEETEKAIYIITELVQGVELYQHIVNHGQLSQQQSALYLSEVIKAVDYLHQNKICHRDLKPENILIYAGRVKLIDFGLSKEVKADRKLMTTSCGSPCYAAPEMLKGCKYNGFKTDIWALGVTLYAMICGKLPFQHEKTAKLYKIIASGRYQQPVGTSEEVQDLLHAMLQVNSQKRISLSGIKKHPWFKKLGISFETKERIDEWNYPLLRSMQKIFNHPIEKLTSIIEKKLETPIYIYYFLLKDKASHENSSKESLSESYDGAVHLDYVFKDMESAR